MSKNNRSVTIWRYLTLTCDGTRLTRDKKQRRLNNDSRLNRLVSIGLQKRTTKAFQKDPDRDQIADHRILVRGQVESLMMTSQTCRTSMTEVALAMTREEST